MCIHRVVHWTWLTSFNMYFMSKQVYSPVYRNWCTLPLLAAPQPLPFQWKHEVFAFTDEVKSESTLTLYFCWDLNSVISGPSFLKSEVHSKEKHWTRELGDLSFLCFLTVDFGPECLALWAPVSSALPAHEAGGSRWIASPIFSDKSHCRLCRVHTISGASHL